MIDIEQAGRSAEVAELPDDEIGTDDEVVSEFSLNAKTEVDAGRAGEITNIKRALFIHFDIGDGKIPMGRRAAG